MSKYFGVIIEESLNDAAILDNLQITYTKVEPVTPSHETPDIAQWTLHSIQIDSEQVQSFAKQLSHAIKPKWYAHFYDEKEFVVVFSHKVFFFNKGDQKGRTEVEAYGISIGIPAHQIDFTDKDALAV